VAPGTLQARSAAVLRGRVLDEANEPLPGAVVRVHDHPELGQTLTRFDGEYDLVVNGGGPLTLEFSHSGYLAAQRTLDVPWQDYAFVEDLALLPPDALSSQLQFPTTSAHVHSATTSDDARGVRTATIYIPSGTDAEMVLTDGSSVSMSSLALRATEFSVGANPALALPAELPQTASLTYTVELSADEANAASADRIELSQTASLYLENFLALPTGSVVPVGYYDRGAATWLGLDNGRVIEILAVNAGLADLDVDGSGNAATPETLSALGISAEELETLAGVYFPGAALWRARVQHLAPFDLSLPYQTDVGLGGTPALAPTSPEVLDGQVLTASLPVAGTGLSLRYRSDRVLGHKAAQMLDVPAAGASVSDALLGSVVDIRVAGQRHWFTFDASAGNLAQLTWDGRDGEGRPVQGERHVDIRVGSIFSRGSVEASGFLSSYAHTSFAGDAYDLAEGVDVRWLRYQRNLRRWDGRELGVGAWSIDQHHRFDPVGRVLYRGDGALAAQSSSLIIEHFAGIANTAVDAGDSGPASEASLNSPRALAVGPDGALYIGGRLGVRRVDANTGIITTVAGGKDQTRCNANLQEGSAFDMCLFVRKLDFGRDGALYITDNPTASGSVDRIRRLDLATGRINHVAGAPNACSSNGDGGSAKLTGICNLLSHANGPDGSIYLLDRGATGVPPRVRKISPNGIIQTIGTGSWSSAEDAGDIAVGPDGSLYVTQPRIIQRILPTGEIQGFAGDPSVNGSSGEGGPATLARFGSGGPNGVMVGPDGRVYVGDNGNGQIRRIDQAGIIQRIAGTTPTSAAGNGGSPLLATLGSDVLRTALALDGTLYVTARSNQTVRVIRPRFVENAAGEVLVQSDDQAETYRFDANGRHLDTVATATGTILHAFGYDSAGRLTSVTSAGHVTQIERDAAGNPIRILAPAGEETLLDTDENGYLSNAIDPTGGETTLGYDAEGLLVQQLDANGNSFSYSYDAEGRLVP
jgi:YD repeat-containing protein